MAGDSGLEARNVAGALTSMRVDELISNLAIGIAQGQMKLDQVCMDIARFMGEAQIEFGKKPNSDEPDLMSLVELGFTPNFYQFVDTILEVRVSVSSQFEESRTYDTSELNYHSDEVANQTDYQQNQSSSSSNYGYGRSFGWGWGHFGYNGSGYNNASSQSSSTRTTSSYKSKNIALNTVDARFASTYNYSVEGASTIKTKIVPVPPPEVLEEILRSKVQQRKEDEQRGAWTRELNNILSGVRSSTDSLVVDKMTTSGGNARTTYALDVAEALVADLQRINGDYAGMTTDHWAVVASVDKRKVADDAINAATTSIGHIHTFAKGETVENVTPATAAKDAFDRLNDFSAALSAILDMMAARAADAGDAPAADAPAGDGGGS